MCFTFYFLCLFYCYIIFCTFYFLSNANSISDLDPVVDLKLDVKTHELKMPQLSSDQLKVREQNRISQIAFKV